MGIPKKDSQLVQYSKNVAERLTDSPGTWHMTAPEATAFGMLAVGYEASYDALMSARNSGTRSKSLLSAMTAARSDMLDSLRGIYGAVQSSPTISDADKDLLGVTVKRKPTPIPVPQGVPQVDVVAVNGSVVTVRIHDAAGDGKRSKPAGVVAAAISSAHGPVVPTDPSAYKWEGSTTKHVVEIVFPESVTPGTKWLNAKQQAGPGCTPVSATIGFGGTMQQAA